MKKTVKFGGSSLADAVHVQKVVDIIKADPSRLYVIPSAPGRRFKGDLKVTDMLIKCFEIQKHDSDQGREYFKKIEERYDSIIRDLGLDFSLDNEYRTIISRMEEGLSKEYLVSRGEYLCGCLLANILGFPFLDSEECIRFDARGQFDENQTYAAFEKFSGMEKFVMPGFYGANESGRIRTFSRGGSDITGSIVSKAMNVDVYENWTDVSGFLVADPNIIDSPESVKEVSYGELRELSYMGAQVFHEEAIFPARSAGIPINIKNTNRPQDVGSWILPDDQITDQHAFITGITGKKGFVAMSFEKDIGSDRLTFGRKILQVFEEAMVMVEHVPSSIGTMTVVVSADEIKGKEESILRRIRREIDPYSMKVERNLALVAIVGQRIADVIGSTYQILKAIADQHIGVRLVIQGVNEITLIVGVDEKDFEKTVECLYEYREKAEKEQS